MKEGKEECEWLLGSQITMSAIPIEAVFCTPLSWKFVEHCSSEGYPEKQNQQDTHRHIHTYTHRLTDGKGIGSHDFGG